MRRKIQKYIPTQTLVLIACVLVLLSVFVFPPNAHSATGSPVTGYAWSDTIGWISLNCSNEVSGFCSGTSNYGFSIAADGTISGYAWSDTVGWISANASDVSGCPSAPCTPVISPATGVMTGWIKAISGGSGGWDGWISLKGSGYGVTLASNGNFNGWAWGSDVVGWLSFNCANNSSCGTVNYLAQTIYKPCTPNSNVCIDGSTLRHYNADCTYSDATCQFAAYGYGCSGNACMVPPSPAAGTVTGGIQVIPRFVRSGNTVQVSWDIVNADPASCTVSGTNGDAWNGLASATRTSSPITSETTYTLHCNGSAVSILTFDAQATVSIVPTFKEI